MPEIKDLITKYLEEARLMQVATSINNQPWACSVYFVFDNDFNLYWISTPKRRHSLEIKENSKVAGTIVLPHTRR
ncbi:pyridoxamine 5'-phosphate oxidase family protein [candidate division WWE3 bacterium]|nr:pyridoxamine 5'-phosphate oxidase family protein [candidate division WWE3 bacterium]